MDEDDRQKGGSFNRVIAQVFCGNNDLSINEEILYSAHATVYPEFCNVSEFATNSWGVKYCAGDELQEGLLSLPFQNKGNGSVQTDTIKNCDASYPDFCISSPPPDLDCKDISRKMFTVRGSDPHRFDLDGNGMGCES